MTDDTIDEAKLRELMKEVEALPRSIDPPADAWAKIRAEIEATGDTGHGDEVIELQPKRAGRVAFWQRPMFLAAAALLLVAGSSAVTAIALNRRGAPSGSVRCRREWRLAQTATLARRPGAVHRRLE